MVLKPVRKRPVLKKVVKPFPLTPGKVNPDLSCQYEGNFPYKPEMKVYEAITTQEELMWLEEQMMCIPAFAYDTETNTLKVLSDNDEFKFVGISFSWGENNTYYIPVGHVREEDLYNQLDIDVVTEFLFKLFARMDVRIYGWNLKFDFHVLKRIGVSVATRDVFDGMLASWLCDENTPNGLKENSGMKLYVPQEHFKEATETVPNEVKKQFGFKANSNVTFDLVLVEDALPYLCRLFFLRHSLCKPHFFTSFFYCLPAHLFRRFLHLHKPYIFRYRIVSCRPALSETNFHPNGPQLLQVRIDTLSLRLNSILRQTLENLSHGNRTGFIRLHQHSLDQQYLSLLIRTSSHVKPRFLSQYRPRQLFISALIYFKYITVPFPVQYFFSKFSSVFRIVGYCSALWVSQ